MLAINLRKIWVYSQKNIVIGWLGSQKVCFRWKKTFAFAWVSVEDRQSQNALRRMAGLEKNAVTIHSVKKGLVLIAEIHHRKLSKSPHFPTKDNFQLYEKCGCSAKRVCDRLRWNDRSFVRRISHKNIRWKPVFTQGMSCTQPLTLAVTSKGATQSNILKD